MCFSDIGDCKNMSAEQSHGGSIALFAGVLGDFTLSVRDCKIDSTIAQRHWCLQIMANNQAIGLCLQARLI